MEDLIRVERRRNKQKKERLRTSTIGTIEKQKTALCHNWPTLTAVIKLSVLGPVFAGVRPLVAARNKRGPPMWGPIGRRIVFVPLLRRAFVIKRCQVRSAWRPTPDRGQVIASQNNIFIQADWAAIFIFLIRCRLNIGCVPPAAIPSATSSCWKFRAEPGTLDVCDVAYVNCN